MNNVKNIITEKKKFVKETYPQGEETFCVRDLRDKNYFRIDNPIIEIYGRLLGGIGIAIYNALAIHTGKSQRVWPKEETIAWTLNCNKFTIIEYLKILSFLRIIRIIRVGKRCTNRYDLLDKKHWRLDFKKMGKELREIKKKSNIFIAFKKEIAHFEWLDNGKSDVNDTQHHKSTSLTSQVNDVDIHRNKTQLKQNIKETVKKFENDKFSDSKWKEQNKRMQEIRKDLIRKKIMPK